MRIQDLLKKPPYKGLLADVAIKAKFNIFAQGKDDFSVLSQHNVNFS